MELAEETELRLKGELRFARERLDEARADARIWRQNYERAIAVASIFVPADLIQILDEHTYREFERGGA